MHWILLAIIAVLLILMAGRYPKVAFSLLGVLVAAVVALYQLFDDQEGGLKDISVEQVKIQDIRLTPYYADGFRVSGTIQNQSEDHDISELEIRFSVLDCPTGSEDNADCQTVSELSRKVRVHIPYSESTLFETTIQPGELKMQGERRWKFKVIGVTGRTPLR